MYLTFIKHLLKNNVVRVALFIVFSISLFGIIGHNRAEAERGHATKNFVSITIEPGDTLWSIAEENITDEYDDINDYIKEVKKMNCLSGSDITSGRHIIIPRYTID